MAAFNPPAELNGIPLSERSRWLLYAPVWMLFPNWRRKVMREPTLLVSPGLFSVLRPELRTDDAPPARWRRSWMV